MYVVLCYFFYIYFCHWLLIRLEVWHGFDVDADVYVARRYIYVYRHAEYVAHFQWFITIDEQQYYHKNHKQFLFHLPHFDISSEYTKYMAMWP